MVYDTYRLILSRAKPRVSYDGFDSRKTKLEKRREVLTE
jgi:hypothetical protein